MALYLWDQNNSGGRMVVDDKLTHRVVIEADTYEEAEKRAFDLGIYYDGCYKGVDCSCCGDRWYNGEEVTVPKDFREINNDGRGYYFKWPKYKQINKTTREYLFDDEEDYLLMLVKNYGFSSPDCRIFYKDGTTKELFT